eukprot:14379041-Alexandrium_andersonii.AAC.1
MAHLRSHLDKYATVEDKTSLIEIGKCISLEKKAIASLISACKAATAEVGKARKSRADTLAKAAKAAKKDDAAVQPKKRVKGVMPSWTRPQASPRTCQPFPSRRAGSRSSRRSSKSQSPS